MPRLLHAAARGDLSGLDGFLRPRHSGTPPAGELSQGLHASALCGDWRFPWGDVGDSAGDPDGAILARAADRLPAAELGPFDRETATGNGIVQQCLHWPRRRRPRTDRGQAAAGADPPARREPRPLDTARVGPPEAALAPRGKLVVIPGPATICRCARLTDEGRRAVAEFSHRAALSRVIQLLVPGRGWRRLQKARPRCQSGVGFPRSARSASL